MELNNINKSDIFTTYSTPRSQISIFTSTVLITFKYYIVINIYGVRKNRGILSAFIKKKIVWCQSKNEHIRVETNMTMVEMDLPFIRLYKYPGLKQTYSKARNRTSRKTLFLYNCNMHVCNRTRGGYNSTRGRPPPTIRFPSFQFHLALLYYLDGSDRLVLGYARRIALQFLPVSAFPSLIQYFFFLIPPNVWRMSFCL